MVDPFIDVLEWWNEDHWLKNSNYEQVQTAKYSFPAILHRISETIRRQDATSWFYVQHFAEKVIKELYPTRIDSIHGGATWSFNNHPDTTFKDIQAVLISCSEIWRQNA